MIIKKAQEITWKIEISNANQKIEGNCGYILINITGDKTEMQFNRK